MSPNSLVIANSNVMSGNGNDISGFFLESTFLKVYHDLFIFYFKVYFSGERKRLQRV